MSDRYHMRDFHATILRLLGLEQNRLWYLHNGRNEKLTDFGGSVIQKVSLGTGPKNEGGNVKGKNLRGIICTLGISLLLAPGAARAAVTGTILGTVSDQSGAIVPSAVVTLNNAETGFSRQANLDVSGLYQFLSVPVGVNYTVAVEAPGFQKGVEAGIRLLVNQTFRANFELKVGATSTEVSVNASAFQVETTSTQIGEVIQDTKITALPLNGRSYIDLLGLQAGVVPVSSGSSSTDHAVSGNGSTGMVSVNGSREVSNSFLVNGSDVQESTNSGASVVPTLDSIQEFRLLTNSFDAEYGRFTGAIVNVVTKGGSNSFHGSLFEFLRNDKLDARNFFDANRTDPTTNREIPNSARGVFKRNQFGGVFGGPIVKNRLFSSATIKARGKFGAGAARWLRCLLLSTALAIFPMSSAPVCRISRASYAETILLEITLSTKYLRSAWATPSDPVNRIGLRAARRQSRLKPASVSSLAGSSLSRLGPRPRRER